MKANGEGKNQRTAMKNENPPDVLRQVIAWLLIVALTPLAAGCDTMRDSTMTGRWWDAAVNRCLPAPKPNLKLYRTLDRDDVLVTYDELREKDDSIRRQAFFVKPNVRKLEEGKRPKFISPAKVAALKLIPVAEAGNTNPPASEIVWVKISEDSQEFTLVWHGADLGPYALPVYADRGSAVRRAVFTPISGAGDLIVVVVIVGLAVGVVFLYFYAAGQSSSNR
jgi:hypothetical protein